MTLWQSLDEAAAAGMRLSIYGSLNRQASNLERYPFQSATMAEAGRLAANALRNTAESLPHWCGRCREIFDEAECPFCGDDASPMDECC